MLATEHQPQTQNTLNGREESDENPKMLEVRRETVYQSVFTYALGIEESDYLNSYVDDTLLFAIVAGSDSSLQAVKAVVSSGWSVTFGYGEKTDTDYQFHQEKRLKTEKGAYEFFTMNIRGNKKALAIIHEKLTDNNEFVLSFDGKPDDDIANLLGGSKYGLHILEEWKEPIYRVLDERNHIVEMPIYYDGNLFPNGLKMLSIDLEEEQADDLVSELITSGTITFPYERQGDGSQLESIDNLTDYMMEFSDDMVEKLAEHVQPDHDPNIDEPLEVVNDFPRELFPVQAHVTTAIAKRLTEQKSVILQGEMSTGKSSMMTAIAEGIHALQHKRGKEGYFSCLMVPPSLTRKWPEEIRKIVPDADIHVISQTEQLIRFHSEWTRQGRPKPKKPTFFIISFTTMRGDARTVPSVTFERQKTKQQLMENEPAYKSGYYCPSCGYAHQVKEDEMEHVGEDGEVEIEAHWRNMEQDEFGTSRRLTSSVKPANAFCSHCGESLWTKKVSTRYSSFQEWVKHEKKLVHAIEQDNPNYVRHIQQNQPEIRSQKGMPRKIAAVEYIRRKMKNFFDISVIDEVHELKGGMTAQGNALGSLVSVSKKVLAGTGTLFGGKAQDIYYLLWRMFPHEMVKAGYKFSEVRRFNEEFGNIETTTYERGESSEYSNSNSRGGTKRTEKVLPGISPFIYGKFLVQNTVNVRLVDVWPDPVELVDTPTIFVDMNAELKEAYDDMIQTFKREIDERDDGYKLYLPMTDYGVSYVDNPFHFPTATYINEDGNRETVWDALHLNEEQLLPKEEKLQEIIQTEMSEGRKSIVYVRDTGSSVPERDVRPRLKHVLEQIGAKVCILDTSTTKTNKRSEWLENKMEKEGYDVCITSQELVKVGLDLLCTPTLIYYQFSWSLFTINQSAKRAWRIGQDKECRLYYLSYKDTHQETMATLIAQKNKATAAINGEVSSDGLSAMLGDEGDLQAMLVNTIKKSGKVLKGSAEDWTASQSERAREILANIGNNKQSTSLIDQLLQWANQHISTPSTLNVLKEQASAIASCIENQQLSGFTVHNQSLDVDFISAFGMPADFVSDGQILSYLTDPLKEAEVTCTQVSKAQEGEANDLLEFLSVVERKETKRNKKKEPINGQLAFELF